MFWKVAKTTAVMFAVGMLLSLALPPVTVALGFAADTTAAATMLGLNAQPLWLGGFVATFGAIQAVVAPLFDRMDGTAAKTEAAQAKIDAHLAEAGRAPSIDLTPEREIVSSHHRQQEENRRAASAAVASSLNA